ACMKNSAMLLFIPSLPWRVVVSSGITAWFTYCLRRSSLSTISPPGCRPNREISDNRHSLEKFRHDFQISDEKLVLSFAVSILSVEDRGRKLAPLAADA